MRKLIYISGLLIALAGISGCKGHSARKSNDTVTPVKEHSDTNNGGGMNVPVTQQDTTGRPISAGDTAKKNK